MSIENPFNKPSGEKNEEPIKGDGFVLVRGKGIRSSSGFSHKTHPIELRPGESTEAKIKEDDEAMKKEIERTKDFTDADHAENLLSGMLKGNNPYSETFKIKSDGKFDKILRQDGYPVYFLGYSDTPEELYKIAAEIEQKYPEFKFSFETDPEGKWMKYTVSKSEK